MLSRNDTGSHALIYDLVPVGLNLVLEDILKLFSVNQKWEGWLAKFWSNCAYADMNCFLSVPQRSVRRCLTNKFTSKSTGIVRGRWMVILNWGPWTFLRSQLYRKSPWSLNSAWTAATILPSKLDQARAPFGGGDVVITELQVLWEASHRLDNIVSPEIIRVSWLQPKRVGLSDPGSSRLPKVGPDYHTEQGEAVSPRAKLCFWLHDNCLCPLFLFQLPFHRRIRNLICQNK